jgi:uncharacterized protein with HEPN domain
MQWKKIIGLRNGLVHDYLNIDLLIIEHIIRQRQYLQLGAFSSKAVDILQEAEV